MNAAHERMADWLEQAWLQRYLDRGLSPEEVEWFEVYAIDKPHLVRALAADSDLRDGLAAQAHGGTAGAELAATPLRRRGPPALLPLGLAASLVVGLAGGWLLAGESPSPQGVLAAPTRVVFDADRGAFAKTIVHPGPPTTPFVLVEVGMPTDARNAVLVVGRKRVPLTITPDGLAGFLWPLPSAPEMDAAAIEFEGDDGWRRIDLQVEAFTGEQPQ